MVEMVSFFDYTELILKAKVIPGNEILELPREDISLPNFSSLTTMGINTSFITNTMV